MNGGLVDFLVARIAEDEADARDTEPLSPHAVFDHDVTGWWRTERVLAELGAKRGTLRLAEKMLESSQPMPGLTADEAEILRAVRMSARTLLALLATPYAGHPDYRIEWAILDPT